MIGRDIVHLFEEVKDPGAGQVDVVCDLVDAQGLGQVFLDVLLHRKGRLRGIIAGIQGGSQGLDMLQEQDSDLVAAADGVILDGPDDLKQELSVLHAWEYNGGLQRIPPRLCTGSTRTPRVRISMPVTTGPSCPLCPKAARAMPAAIPASCSPSPLPT